MSLRVSQYLERLRMNAIRRYVSGDIGCGYTPTPVGGRAHTLGGGLGVFSREAKNDHKGFYDLDSLTLLFQNAGLKLVDHRYYMAGMNQLAISQRV